MAPDIPSVLTLRDLRQILHIGRNTALGLIHEGLLPGHFVGGKWLVLKEDLEEFIKRS